MAVCQGRSVCAGCVYILCVCASVCVPEEDCVSMCPLGCVLCECVFALSVLLYSCVLMPVCSYVRVSAIQALCVLGPVLRVQQGSWPPPHAESGLFVRASLPPEGRGGKGRWVSLHFSTPPPPVPHPHSLSPGIEPYLESRFDICFQI